MICSFDEISLSRTYCAGSLSVCFMKYSNISVSMRSARSCDVVLLVDVEDRNALTEYDHDKYHCEVVKTHMHAVCASSTSADYEY